MVGIHTRVGEKGQVVIPKPIRQHFHIGPNSDVVFEVEDDKIVIHKKRPTEQVLNEFFSAIKKGRLPKRIDWDKEYYSQFE